ncbi:hypothetical protein [Vibrio quintilis]|uniref:Uncharacterized protein n=1 Tax=Vibrio quintilis TaxID=1117707 RepID=A0A1M7Z241_9VIBR|nr:hypothetical protein [Vibrio quintilis]SHO58963.1 hypothetical protein VQ7734_04738 [Vibrio quintilis]
MIGINDLKNRIESTLNALEQKQRSSQEAIVDNFIVKYMVVQSAIQSGKPKEEILKEARILLGSARGYLETSSNYEQEFLKEMSKTEKLIKQLKE